MFKKLISVGLVAVSIFLLTSVGSSAAITSKNNSKEYIEYFLDGDENEYLPSKTEKNSCNSISGTSQNKPLSISVGYDTLLTQWRVRKSTSNNKKYAYYSPVVDKNDNNKYPVVIYIHGLFHGWTDTSFKKSGLTYWCCQEIQEKFAAGGAHLIAPKIPETTITATQKNNVMEIIKDYVEENKDNIDMSQIYIMGGSAGGGLAWNILIDNPEYFSKALILCATSTLSAKEAQKIANVPVWEVSANTDPLVNILLQKSTWNNISKYSKVKSQCRWTRFTNHVTLPDGSHPGISHFLAKTIGYNFCTISDKKIFPQMNTIDGNNNSVTLSWNDSIIEWLQA